MGYYSPTVKYKYLGFAILLLILFSLGHANSFAEKNSTYLQVKDTTKPAEVAGDSSKIQAKGKDTSRVQVADTANSKGKDTSTAPTATNVQPADSSKQVPDSVVYKQTNFKAEELIRGERLFYGLVYLENKSVNCASCHNARESDTLNWNPDAFEISKKYLSKSAKELSKVLLKPVGKKMKLVHKDFQLSPEDIVLIKAYMDRFVNIGLKADKPVVTYLLLLIIAGILFLVAFIDLIIKKIFRNRKIDWAIITVTGIFITWLFAVDAIAFGRSKGYSPAQPIKFSHYVHAGQNKTDCNYCHYTAKTSKSAGIPPGSVCYNCHFLVRNGTRSGATEISKIINALDSGKSVQWVRIYRLPDFVFFSHEQHVSAGQLNCEACHGPVKEMNRLYQFSDLSMGWCIDCHKTRKVNMSNEYYKTYYPGLYNDLKAGKIDSVRVIGIGGRDCGKCHY